MDPMCQIHQPLSTITVLVVNGPRNGYNPKFKQAEGFSEQNLRLEENELAFVDTSNGVLGHGGTTNQMRGIPQVYAFFNKLHAGAQSEFLGVIRKSGQVVPYSGFVGDGPGYIGGNKGIKTLVSDGIVTLHRVSGQVRVGQTLYWHEPADAEGPLRPIVNTKEPADPSKGGIVGIALSQRDPGGKEVVVKLATDRRLPRGA